MFTLSTKREIRHFRVVVVQWRQRNVQKSVMHVQNCCFASLNLLLFCRSRWRRRRGCSSCLIMPRLHATIGCFWNRFKNNKLCLAYKLHPVVSEICPKAIIKPRLQATFGWFWNRCIIHATNRIAILWVPLIVVAVLKSRMWKMW